MNFTTRIDQLASLLLFGVFLLLSSSLWGQSPVRPDLTPAEEKFMTNGGFNLSKYNWDNEQVNYQLDLSRRNFENSDLLFWGGIGVAAVGLPLTILGANKVAWGDSPAVLAMGTIFTLGGTVGLCIGASKKGKARYHLDKAIDAFDF